MYANYEDPEADREAEIKAFAKSIKDVLDAYRKRPHKGKVPQVDELIIDKMKKDNWIRKPITHDY